MKVKWRNDNSGTALYTRYYLNDRLGNHRVVLSDQGSVIQINNYYPSGVTMAEPSRMSSQGYQPYKFGGKELDRFNSVNVYDFEARTYDPALMRFTSVDPMAHKYPGISPMAYCANNPVNRIDPDGRDDIFTNKGVFIKTDDKKTDNILIETKAKDGSTESSAISTVKLSNSAIKSIVGHYNSQLDESDGEMKGVKIEAVYMKDPKTIMKVQSHKPNTIQVNMQNGGDSEGGKIRKELNTVPQMKNILVHERAHVNQFLGKRDDVFQMELDAIKIQREHPTWRNVGEDYIKVVRDMENHNLNILRRGW